MLLRLVRQFLRQTVALLGGLAALLLLGVELGLELAHARPQLSGSLCQDKKETSASTKNKFLPEDPARLLSSRPESRGLHPAGALTCPRGKEDEVLTSALRQISGLLGQLLELGVVGGRTKVVVVLQQRQQKKKDLSTRSIP